MQDTYVPFFATASEKLEAGAEADGDASAPGGEPEPEAKEGEETKDAEAKEAAAETSPPASETAGATPTLEGDEKPEASESIPPAGETAEGPDATTAEPMSQEESLGGLDGLVEEGAKEPMSQEEAAVGSEAEPMSQSGPEHLEDAKAVTSAETSKAHAEDEDDVLGRKRSAEQTAAGDAQGDVGQGVGVAMETDEAKEDGEQASRGGQEGGKGAAVSGTCDSSDPSVGR